VHVTVPITSLVVINALNSTLHLYVDGGQLVLTLLTLLPGRAQQQFGRPSHLRKRAPYSTYHTPDLKLSGLAGVCASEYACQIYLRRRGANSGVGALGNPRLLFRVREKWAITQVQPTVVGDTNRISVVA
jgi:hypothetical protein